MTLTFLGQAYEATQPEVAAIPTETAGTYRGCPMRFSSTHTVPQTTTRLTYRGVRYCP